MAIRYLPGLPRTAELVVIGGGIVGAATAFHAARAGLRPLVLERRPALCSLTTAVAAGGFRLQLETREQLELVRESAELFLHFAEATGQRGYDPAVRQQGYLWLTTTAEGAERQRRLVERQRAWGVGDVDLLDGDEARRAFPFLAKEVVQARFRAADGLLDPKAVTMGLVAASDAGVVAAGPFSGEVARLAGVALPVTAVRRQKLVMPEVPQVPADAPMTIDDDTGVHWRPAFRGASLLFAERARPARPPLRVPAPGPGQPGLREPGDAVLARGLGRVVGTLDAPGGPLHDDAGPPAADRPDRGGGPAGQQRLQRPRGDGRPGGVQAVGRPAHRQARPCRQPAAPRSPLRRRACR